MNILDAAERKAVPACPCSRLIGVNHLNLTAPVDEEGHGYCGLGPSKTQRGQGGAWDLRCSEPSAQAPAIWGPVFGCPRQIAFPS